ncbi:MAG: reverse transcriptase domain-containing protein [Polyangiaceae bacterium]
MAGAGVLEEGQLRRPDVGTPQGGVISPLLANVFLHYVLDDWVAAALGRMKRKYTIVRFADDFVMAFEDFLDCRRVLEVLGSESAIDSALRCIRQDPHDRLSLRRTMGGILHQGRRSDFLGFTHVWGKSRRGKNVVYQRTAKRR